MSASTKHRKLSFRVIERIAGHKGVDEVDLNPPLYDVIDLEALDALFSKQVNGGPRAEGTVTFRYNGYEVAVSSNGDVELRENGD